MDTFVQAIVMGIVQGLSEFLPISSSGHLIIVPYVFGWTDPFITSLAFSVMLHIGTLVALLVYFRDDWIRLVPAGFAAIRDRTFGGDPDRRLAWLLVVATIPAAIAGGIGVAQALALIPGFSRSGISISAARFAGLDREAAARFSFLMATPVTAGAAVFEIRKLLTGEAGVDVSAGPLLAGMLAAFVSGMIAIGFMLRYLRTRSLTIFVVYRIVVAAVVVVVWLR